MTVDELFKQAYALQCEGKLAEAINSYGEALKLDPDHSPSLHFLGIAYAQIGELQTAITFLRQALYLEPKNANFHNNLANVYKNAQQTAKAIEHYQEAIRLNPGYAQAHHNLATVYAAQNSYKDALEHYRLAVHAEPDFVAAHFNLGLLLLKNNQLKAAKTQFKNVLTLNPENSDAAFYSGVLCLEANELDEAEHHFHKVLTQDSNQIQAITNLGVIALKREQGQLAVDFFSRALVVDNNYIEARNNLAAIFMHYDRFENALMHYDVLLKQEPGNIEYLYNSGVAQMALGHLSEAMFHFEKLLDIDKCHFPSLNNLAAIYIRLEDKEKAKTLLQRALAANPKDASSRHMLNALTGDKLTTEASPEYAQNLFNNYALYYDQHMKDQLHYSLPQQIARVIYNLELNNLARVVDLGCGTGLTGIVLRDICQHLTGVDLAAKMLAQAREKGIYDQLIESDLLRFISENKELYQLATAADVLPYLGNLDDLFAALKKRLAPEGYFIFTTEISKDQPWQLQSTARFSHHPDYISQLCLKNALKLVHQEQVTGRQQNNDALPVMLYVAQNST
ncbi:TPR repeat-containing protein YrrB [Legionella massiliensis]|uniref:TPR repeat-containing protein YrrB n=1 Tax=Legionella massiliensis TaxID=1034943 RepID=A0A078KXW2_9GAMM|nr:tetratricopeptide repeat protein [Legionella massiliensis]CDZ76568.1 TPR repeat-containing protein YrrB [Legionella massiliensis]CEE12306.1 TPR repeat-containing protein YrrB [Legionella massiliensis]